MISITPSGSDVDDACGPVYIHPKTATLARVLTFINFTNGPNPQPFKFRNFKLQVPGLPFIISPLSWTWKLKVKNLGET